MAVKKSINDMLAQKKEPVKTFEQVEKAKGGRPKKEAGEKAKENRFAVYFTPAELSIVKLAADSFGMTVGKYIKIAVMRSAKKDSIS